MQNGQNTKRETNALILECGVNQLYVRFRKYTLTTEAHYSTNFIVFFRLSFILLISNFIWYCTLLFTFTTCIILSPLSSWRVLVVFHGLTAMTEQPADMVTASNSMDFHCYLFVWFSSLDFYYTAIPLKSPDYSIMPKSWSSSHFIIFFFQAARLSYNLFDVVK